MTDMLDERRRGLEEEYFHKKNQEALEKIRAKIAVNKEAKAAAASPMSCPRCSDTLKTNNFEGVNIDICDKCSGVWLDSGEYEQLIKRKVGWFGRLLQSLHPE